MSTEFYRAVDAWIFSWRARREVFLTKDKIVRRLADWGENIADYLSFKPQCLALIFLGTCMAACLDSFLMLPRWALLSQSSDRGRLPPLSKGFIPLKGKKRP
jgi:hypothetical protein